MKDDLPPPLLTDEQKAAAAGAAADRAADQQEAENWRQEAEALLSREPDAREAVGRVLPLLSDKERAFLAETGLGDHPTLVGLAVKLGRELAMPRSALGRAGLPTPAAAPARDPSDARSLYPNTPGMNP